MQEQTENKRPLSHNNIERSCSRMWKKRELNQVIKAVEAAGYDVITKPESIVVGLHDTDQVFLRALKGNGIWLVRYDQKLFDEDFEE